MNCFILLCKLHSYDNYNMHLLFYCVVINYDDFTMHLFTLQQLLDGFKKKVIDTVLIPTVATLSSITKLSSIMQKSGFHMMQLIYVVVLF